MRSLFLTDPELILDCVEQMGSPRQNTRDQYKNEETRTDKRILKLLLNAASERKKFRKTAWMLSGKEMRKRRKKEEEEKRDRSCSSWS